MSDVQALKQLVDGVVTTVVALPGQLKRAWDQPPLRALAVETIKARVSLGDSMGYTPYYGGNTQLFRMPPGMGDCSCKHGGLGEDTIAKAMPFIALGIVGIVAWNILKRK